MAVLYRYARKDNNEVVYVGITGTKGRIDGIDAVEIRDKEHFTNKGDPLYDAEIDPQELNLDFIDGLSECDALALETMAIGYYNPKYNTSKKNMGNSDLYMVLKQAGELVWVRMGERRRAARETKIVSKRANGKTAGTVLTDEQIIALKQCVESNKFSATPARDWCIIALILYTGSRISDVVDMNIDDVSEDNIYVFRIGQFIKMAPVLKDAMEKWLEVRREIHSYDTPSPLFISGQYHRISPKTIQWFTSKYGICIGISNCTASTLIATYRNRLRGILYADNTGNMNKL